MERPSGSSTSAWRTRDLRRRAGPGPAGARSRRCSARRRARGSGRRRSARTGSTSDAPDGRRDPRLERRARSNGTIAPRPSRRRRSPAASQPDRRSRRSRRSRRTGRPAAPPRSPARQLPSVATARRDPSAGQLELRQQADLVAVGAAVRRPASSPAARGTSRHRACREHVRARPEEAGDVVRVDQQPLAVRGPPGCQHASPTRCAVDRAPRARPATSRGAARRRPAPSTSNRGGGRATAPGGRRPGRPAG